MYSLPTILILIMSHVFGQILYNIVAFGKVNFLSKKISNIYKFTSCQQFCWKDADISFYFQPLPCDRLFQIPFCLNHRPNGMEDRYQQLTNYINV